MTQETQTGALYQPRGVGCGEGDGGGSKGLGYMYTYGCFMFGQNRVWTGGLTENKIL